MRGAVLETGFLIETHWEHDKVRGEPKYGEKTATSRLWDRVSVS
jgi:hypothetical protein